MNERPLNERPAVQRRTLTYLAGEQPCEGALFRPAEGAGPWPGVLVLHDWSGVNDYVLAVAERVAALGYAACALDVYGVGRRGEPLGDNAALMQPLLDERGLLAERLEAGLDAAARADEVDEGRVAALGYCFGGLCALDLARRSPAGLRAAISVHGSLQAPPGPRASEISARVLVLHGWEDPVAPPADVLTLARELTEAGATWELQAYGHALHAFSFAAAKDPARGVAFHPLASARSWRATVDFLAETIGYSS